MCADIVFHLASGAGAAALRAEDFPALPTVSRNQRRRQRGAGGTLASRLTNATAAPRVLNRASPGDFPTLGSTGSSRTAMASSTAASGGTGAAPVRHSQSTGSLVDPAAEPSSSEDDTAAGSATTADDFPSLGGGAAAAAGQAHPSWVPVRHAKGKKCGGNAAAPAPASSTMNAAGPRLDDFPSLAAGLPAAGSSGRSAKGTQSPAVSAAVAAQQAGGVSDTLKSANKAFIDKIKTQLDEESFVQFRQLSAEFMKGQLDAGERWVHVVQKPSFPLQTEPGLAKQGHLVTCVWPIECAPVL